MEFVSVMEMLIADTPQCCEGGIKFETRWRYDDSSSRIGPLVFLLGEVDLKNNPLPPSYFTPTDF